MLASCRSAQEDGRIRESLVSITKERLCKGIAEISTSGFACTFQANDVGELERNQNVCTAEADTFEGDLAH
jgi:hypothetical protein